MANPTSNFGWQMPTPVDLVTDLPADFEVFGQAVDSSLADLKGGSTGQVLSKNSNTDMDFVWVTSDDANAIQNTIVDAKGDLIAASAADTPARLAVGTNGQVLAADSTTATGLKWALEGLSLISRTSFSNVAGQNFDDVFSSTYSTYKVVIESINATTGSDTLKFQWRTSGTTQTTAYYGAVGGVYYAATTYLAAVPSNNATSLQISNSGIGSGTTTTAQLSFDVFNAGVSGRARIAGNGIEGQNAIATFYGGYRDATETVTGFRLTSSSTNITGTVSIYGYGK